MPSNISKIPKIPILCLFFSSFSSIWPISNSVIFHQIKFAKYFRNSCRHLVVETGSWFILITAVKSVYYRSRKRLPLSQKVLQKLQSLSRLFFLHLTSWNESFGLPCKTLVFSQTIKLVCFTTENKSDIHWQCQTCPIVHPTTSTANIRICSKWLLGTNTLAYYIKV